MLLSIARKAKPLSRFNLQILTSKFSIEVKNQKPKLSSEEEFNAEMNMPEVSTEKILRKKKNKYINYTPIMIDWASQIVNGKQTLEDIENDKKFIAVADKICESNKHSDSNILNLIKSCIIMGMDPHSKLVQNLENQLLLRLNDFDLKSLIRAYELYFQYENTSSLRATIIDRIISRISEKLENTDADLQQIINLISLSKHFPMSLLIQIEQQTTRFLDHCEDISINQLCYLIVLLSRFNRRCMAIIRNIVSKLLLFKNEDVYTMPPDIINMLHGLSRLNYYEVNLIEKSTDILIKFDFLLNNTSSSKRDFLVTVSRFNFYYPKLIDYYMQSLIERPELFKQQDLVTLCITLARLNCRQPDVIETIKNHVLPRLTDDYSSLMQHFNLVFSLTFLGVATPEQKKRFLSIDAFEELNRGDVDSPEKQSENSQKNSPDYSHYQRINFQRKWLNFVGLNKIHKDLYESLFENENKRNEFEEFVNNVNFQSLKKSKDLSIFRSNIQKTIREITPNGKFYSFDKQIPYGFGIDVEILVDSEGNPKEIGSDNKDYKKVALMCIGFNDTLLDSSELIGLKEIEFSILRSMGYIVVAVHQNVLQNSSILTRAKFLKSLIVSHLNDSSSI